MTSTKYHVSEGTEQQASDKIELGNKYLDGIDLFDGNNPNARQHGF